jgi:hypothetical protein
LFIREGAIRRELGQQIVNCKLAPKYKKVEMGTKPMSWLKVLFIFVWNSTRRIFAAISTALASQTFIVTIENVVELRFNHDMMASYGIRRAAEFQSFLKSVKFLSLS